MVSNFVFFKKNNNTTFKNEPKCKFYNLYKQKLQIFYLKMERVMSITDFLEFEKPIKKLKKSEVKNNFFKNKISNFYVVF